MGFCRHGNTERVADTADRFQSDALVHWRSGLLGRAQEAFFPGYGKRDQDGPWLARAVLGEPDRARRLECRLRARDDGVWEHAKATELRDMKPPTTCFL